MDIVTLFVAVGLSFVAGATFGYAFTAKALVRELDRQAAEIWKLRQ